MSGGGGWGAEGGLYHPQGDRQQQCVLSRAQKQPQSTWQAETVVGSSLTHHVALLVPLSGPRGLTLPKILYKILKSLKNPLISVISLKSLLILLISNICKYTC